MAATQQALLMASDNAAVSYTHLDKLEVIINEAAWTNAKRDAAHKDAAQVARRLLKSVKALVL